MSNLLSNIQVSVMRFCADFIDTHPELTFVNFDAHADDTTAPPGDLMGYSALSLNIDERVVDVQALFGISTQSDMNLFRLNKGMGELLELLKPTCRIKLFDADSGDSVGWMVIQNGTRLFPIGGTSVRPLQYIQISMLSSETLSG